MNLLSVPGHTTVVEIPEAKGMELLHHAQMRDNWVLVFEKDKDNLIVVVNMEDCNYKIVQYDPSAFKQITPPLTSDNYIPECKL